MKYSPKIYQEYGCKLVKQIERITLLIRRWDDIKRPLSLLTLRICGFYFTDNIKYLIKLKSIQYDTVNNVLDKNYS